MAVVHADCTTYIVDWLRDARDLSEMNLALRRELQAMQVTNMSHCHLINFVSRMVQIRTVFATRDTVLDGIYGIVMEIEYEQV